MSGLSDDEFMALGAPADAPQGLTDDQFMAAGAPQPKHPGPLAQTPDDGWLSGAAKGAGTAIIKGLANIPGQFGNVRDFGDFLGNYAESKIRGIPLEEVAKQNQQAFEKARGNSILPQVPQPPSGHTFSDPVLKQTGEYEPSSAWGRAGMAGVEAATSALGPGGGMAGIENAAGKTALDTAKNIVTRGTVQAPMNAVAGAGAQTASDYIGPGAGLLAGVAIPVGGTTAYRAGAAYARPMLASQRPAMARERLLNAAEDPESLQERLLPSSAPQGPYGMLDELVPGSKPTTGQLTGDRGILSEESKINGDGSAIEAQATANNKARQDYLESQAPTADTMRPSEMITRQAQEFEDAAARAEARILETAKNQAANLGPNQTPESIGARIRGAIEQVRTAAQKHISDLYDAVGNPDTVVAPLRDAASDIAGSISEWDHPPSANVTRIFQRLQNLPDTMPFQDVRALSRDITTSMREDKMAGDANSHRLLTQLKGRLEDTINNAVDNQHAYEQAAVARGQMAPEATMEGRLRQLWGLDEPTTAANAATASGTGNGSAGVPRGDTASEAGGVGTGNAPEGRPAAPAGDQGVPPSNGFRQEDADALRTANEAYKGFARTYREGPVAATMAENGTAKSYKTPEGAVPAQAVRSGDTGYDTAKAYLKASENHPEAVAGMQEKLLNQLRGKIKPDGSIDSASLQKWKRDYDGALRAIDEASPGFSSKFDNAANAGDAVTSVAQRIADVRKEFNKTAAAKFMGLTDPREVENLVGQMLQKKHGGVTQLRELVQRMGSDPDALDGLRKAGIDWMSRFLKTTKEAGTSGEATMSPSAMIKMVRESGPMMSVLFNPEQVNSIRALAADLERAQRSTNVDFSKFKKGERINVSPSMEKLKESAQKFNNIWSAMAAGAAPGLMHGEFGKAAAGASAAGSGYLLHKFHGAGLEKVDNLFREAVANPDFARELLRTVPPERMKAQADIAMSALRRGYLSKMATQPKERASGGRIQRKSGGRVEPTEAQKEAGNYKKHHIAFQGMQIAIENRKGSERSGVGGDGKPWSVKMPADYGYIKRTEGADGDHVDVYVGPASKSDKVFVIDQLNDRTGKFDEHKCMLGFANRHDAIDTYRRGFSDGKASKRLGHVTEMTVDAFKDWVRNGDTTKPLAVRRASGGRVITADQLLSMADRAKKNINKTTEPLLQQPDELIVKALDVAHKNLEAN